MRFQIISDSTCDLSQKFINQNDLVVIPMKYQIDGKEYINYADHRELSSRDFYKTLKRVYEAHTTQLNSEEVKEVYRNYLEDGRDLLIIAFSSALSGTYNSIRIAVEELKAEYKYRKIYVIDSLCASGGEGLLVLYANKFREEGLSIDETYQKLLDLRLHIAHWFTVSDIELLRKGGRVTNAQAFAAKMLQIKPVLHVDNEGRLIPVYKKNGRRLAIKELLNQMEKTIDTSFKQQILINHADCLDDALYLNEEVLKLFKKMGYECDNVALQDIGPVIGSHSGPGTLALFFVASHR